MRGGPHGVSAGLFATQALFVVLLLALIAVNRRGRMTLAAWVFCGALALSGSEFFSLPDLDRALVIYAAPIIVAAFLIRPAAAYYILALSVADYLIAYARHAGVSPFNWLSVLVLGGIAIAAWAAARRAAWVEEGEKMYRLELDRAIAELEALEERVARLSEQLTRGDDRRAAG